MPSCALLTETPQHVTSQGWRPRLDNEDNAADYHIAIANYLDSNEVQSLDEFNAMIVECAVQSGSKPKKQKFKHSDEARAIASQRRHCQDHIERKRLSLLLMREAQRYVRSWQSAQMKTIMSKPFKRHELEQIWQVPKRRKQVELKIEHHANALTALFKDDDNT